MKELIPQVWDDLDLAEGKRTPAGPGRSVILRLDGQTVELDLTAAHREHLEEMLAPYLKAGSGEAFRKPRRVPGSLKSTRAYNKEMRTWGEAHGYGWTTGKDGKPYHSTELKKAYAAHLEATSARS